MHLPSVAGAVKKSPGRQSKTTNTNAATFISSSMDGGLGPTAKMDGMCLVPRKSSVDEGLSDDEATFVAFKGTTKLEKPPKTDEEELKSILLGDSGRWSTQSSSNKRVSFSVDVADSEGMMLLLEDLGRSWTSSSLTLEDSGRWTEQSPKSNSWASAEDKTKDVDNNCEEAKNFEDSGVLATTSTESSTQSPKPHKKKRSRKKKRRLTADEKMVSSIAEVIY